MAKARRHKVLFIVLSIVLLVVIGAGGYLLYLSHHYKGIIKARLPEMITRSTDSIYHVSFSDINVSLYDRTVTITNLRLWPDTNHVNALRLRHVYSPNTTSTVFIPKLEAYGIEWEDLATKRSIDCKNIVIHNIKWFMETKKHKEDLSNITDGTPAIGRVTVARMEFIKPHVTFHYVGDHNTYYCYLKGGNAVLNDCAFDHDVKKDTSVFIYAKSGTVKPDSFEFRKDDHIHYVKKPSLDFVSGDNSITLKNVKIKPLTDYDGIHHHDVILYNFNFPSIEVFNFNWRKLLNEDELAASKMVATEPLIDVRYIREYAPEKNRVGKYPHQLIHEAIKINIRALYVKNGRIVYTEPVTKNNAEGTIQFDNVHGSFVNIVNIDSIVARHKSCIVKLEAKYMNKSELALNFDLSLADPKGHFTMDGYLNNLDGEQVTKQAEAFTLAKVTSFHMSHMDMHVEGDESYGKGHFTMLYDGLKLSLFKFKSDDRKKKRGPFSFVADVLLLYPSNPMPNKNVRSQSTSFVRNPQEGFFTLIWKNIYRGAKKTAVRDDRIVDATDGPETGKDVKPRKEGLFKKLFGKKKK